MHQPVDMQTRFPRWDWIQDPKLFTWTLNARIESPQGWLSRLDPRDLSTFFDFTTSLQWRVDPSVSTAFVEFAFLFWKRGYHIHACAASDKTFRDLTFWLRRALVFVNTISDQQIFPGHTDQYKLKTEGKALPHGVIVGAIPRFAIDELTAFANLCADGCSKHLCEFQLL